MERRGARRHRRLKPCAGPPTVMGGPIPLRRKESSLNTLPRERHPRVPPPRPSPRAPCGLCLRALPPRCSSRSGRSRSVRSSTASRSALPSPRCVACSPCFIAACDGAALDPCKRAGCVPTDWDAAASATARAARRDARVGRTGRGREHFRKRRRGGPRRMRAGGMCSRAVVAERSARPVPRAVKGIRQQRQGHLREGSRVDPRGVEHHERRAAGRSVGDHHQHVAVGVALW